ncbi:MAG: OmpA family protein [Phycisphaerae bacterium]
MARSTKLAMYLGLGLVGLGVTGCVSQDKYNAMKIRADRLDSALTQAEMESASARAQAESLKSQLDATLANGGNMGGLVGNLQQQNAALKAEIDELSERYRRALSQVGGSALPAPLASELQAFASQNPDLVEFDAETGTVKFKSDLTFAPGDAELTADAKKVIDRFAAILNSSAAQGYEVRVAGHTDNVPVSNPATRAKGHKDNWYLSAHRAIGVGKALMSQGVTSSRVVVEGYADQRPVASNADKTGMAANRRVEVLIKQSSYTGPGLAATEAPRSTPNTARDTTVGADTNPALNK